MMRKGTTRMAVVLALGLALAGPAAPARAAERGWPGLGRVWVWLSVALPWLPPAPATADQCGAINPNGRCLSGPAGKSADQCSSIDPNGRCLGAGASADQCSIDPNG